MKRGLFFAFLCALVVGSTALALVLASFARPQAFRSLFVGQKHHLAGEEFEGDLSSNAAIVQEVNPGVVTVVAMRALQPGEREANSTTVENNVQRGAGTGFIIEPDGFIVTNEHVIKDAERIRVKLADGREFKAAVKGADRSTDLALLKIEAGDLMPLELGDSDRMHVGDPVIAIGNPFEYERSVTAGIISATGRKVYGVEPYEDFLQTDAAINRGNSGGPLLNRAGEVIGVNTVIHVYGRGISFAVPSNVVKRVVAQLRAYGQVSRGFLGLTPVELTPEFREGLGLEGLQGVLVADVRSESSAERAGFEPYDVVTHFDGRAIRHTDDFFNFVANTQPRKQVEISAIRGGKPIKLYATLDQRPPSGDERAVEVKPTTTTQSKTELELGFSVRENSPQALRDLKLGKLDDGITGGVIVSTVDPLGPAADARLQVGYVILEANRQPIRTLEDFERIKSQLRQGRVLVIRYTPHNQRSLRMAAIRIGEG
jgi:serine protease Do